MGTRYEKSIDTIFRQELEDAWQDIITGTFDAPDSQDIDVALALACLSFPENDEREALFEDAERKAQEVVLELLIDAADAIKNKIAGIKNSYLY